ncbi:MAG: SDR family oxidoreductase [Saprospirales bacterium]|nr:SDR family oxidoreductase [Saprospirales bacterium]MBK8492066.1 SDR family oxidoreductase [Saprospirales bacterium]
MKKLNREVNLIIGATGMVGNEICRLLTAEGRTVRAMVRDTADPEKVRKLKDMGVQIVRGDLRRSVTFGPALEGVTNVITTTSSMPFSYVAGENDIQKVDLEGVKNFIDHAKIAGVEHFIYTSFSGNIDLSFPLLRAKRAVEQHLEESGMEYTILRPGYFMEVWLTPAAGFDFANAKAQICGDGTKPISYISALDVARFATASLDNPAARNTSLELGGPEKISQLKAVQIFEEVSGQKFEVQHVSEKALRTQMDEASDPMQKSFSALMTCAATGNPINMDPVLQEFPIKLTSVKDYARSVVATSFADTY